jgi:hypothetical protein
VQLAQIQRRRAEGALQRRREGEQRLCGRDGQDAGPDRGRAAEALPSAIAQ